MTKAEILEIVKKYSMDELVNNDIEKMQVGWYTVSDGYIKEDA